MIRDRRCGPILIITMTVAFGCGSIPGVGPAGSGGQGGAGAGTDAGGNGVAGSTGLGGSTAGTIGAGGSSGGGGAAASFGGSAAGASGGGAAGASGGSAAGASGGGAAGANGGSAAGSSGGSAAGSSGGSAAGSFGGSAAGVTGSAAGTSGGGAAGSSAGGGGGMGGVTGAAGSAGNPVDPTPVSYRLTCDGSMAVMIDDTHFLDGNDEQQGMRLYTRGVAGSPLATIDISSAIGLAASDEADLEDAARIGDRIYAIGSHGRNKNGKLERSRYRFFAMDVSGTSSGIALSVPGYTSALLDQMLLAQYWTRPDAAVIATLTAASNLGRATDPSLAPLAGGTNIEGLAWLPSTARPNQLLIGFRNPLQAGKAIVVSLLNADAVVDGVTAQFGEAILVDLGGLGIRGMAWSPAHDAVLLIGGPQTDAAGPFRLFKWSGAAADAPIAVADITGVPTASSPEAIVAYPGSRDVQILFDQGDHDVGGAVCKNADESLRVFGDLIMHVP